MKGRIGAGDVVNGGGGGTAGPPSNGQGHLPGTGGWATGPGSTRLATTDPAPAATTAPSNESAIMRFANLFNSRSSPVCDHQRWSYVLWYNGHRQVNSPRGQ